MTIYTYDQINKRYFGEERFQAYEMLGALYMELWSFMSS